MKEHNNLSDIKEDDKQDNLSGFLVLTKKEISKLKKTLRHYFKTEIEVYYRVRQRGNCINYEARFKRFGFNISVSAKDLPTLKARFILALNAAEENKENAVPDVPTTFNAFAQYFFESYTKRKVAEKTFAVNQSRYRIHIQPYFKETQLKKITPRSCQELIDGITAKGYGKTADEVYSILNQIFKAAVKHGLMTNNPIELTVHFTHQNKHGKALTKNEEITLLNATAGTPYQLLYAVALFTGLRPNEYASARIEGQFIVAVNSKRKNRKIEHKKIPITAKLKPYLIGIDKFDFPSVDYARRKIKSILPDHILYDLRTTFYNRCIECGVSDAARHEFMGHLKNKIDEAYTDLSDEYLLSEGKKLDY